MPLHHPHANEIAELYNTHRTWLQAWLYRRVGSSNDAQDLLHDIFVRILKKSVLPRLEEPRAYLKTIANGLVLNHYRAQAIERAYFEALQSLPQEYAPSPEQNTIVLQGLIEMDRLLVSLPTPVRKAFWMSQIEKIPQDEIARQLGLSLATVKRHIARAVVKVSFHAKLTERTKRARSLFTAF